MSDLEHINELNDLRTRALERTIRAQEAEAALASAQAENERLREALKVAEQALSNWYEYDVQGKGTWDGKSERRALTTALRTVSAALSNTDGGEG